MSGRSPVIISAVASAPRPRSTRMRLVSMSNQRRMPAIWSRCGALAARFTWPPTDSLGPTMTTCWRRRVERVAVLAGGAQCAGGLGPGRAGADDPAAVLGALGGGDDMRHGRFAPRRRVLDAEQIRAVVHAVDAVVGADALAYLVLTSLAQ